MTGSLPKLQIEILVDSPNFCMGVVSNVVACSWRGPLNEASLAQWVESVRMLMRRAGPIRHSYVHLMTEVVHMPDSATRNEIAKLLPELAEHTSLSAVVLQGGGFWASALRGFLTGLRVLAPRTFDIRADSSVENLLHWFPAEHEKRTGVSVARPHIEYLLIEAKRWQSQSARQE